ncbi:MAG: outer membrane beta-barrel protein [Deltaproteobacteria bacterium]|nr:outer membrane beta-barrel protein [Deltaproteobacteria bacterium]
MNLISFFFPLCLSIALLFSFEADARPRKALYLGGGGAGMLNTYQVKKDDVKAVDDLFHAEGGFLDIGYQGSKRWGMRLRGAVMLGNITQTDGRSAGDLQYYKVALHPITLRIFKEPKSGIDPYVFGGSGITIIDGLDVDYTSGSTSIRQTGGGVLFSGEVGCGLHYFLNDQFTLFTDFSFEPYFSFTDSTNATVTLSGISQNFDANSGMMYNFRLGVSYHFL